MSVPTAVILTLVAFVGGLFIGNVTARRGARGGGDEIAAVDEAEGDGAGSGPSIDDDVDRLRVPV